MQIQYVLQHNLTNHKTRCNFMSLSSSIIFEVLLIIIRVSSSKRHIGYMADM